MANYNQTMFLQARHKTVLSTLKKTEDRMLEDRQEELYRKQIRPSQATCEIAGSGKSDSYNSIGFYYFNSQTLRKLGCPVLKNHSLDRKRQHGKDGSTTRKRLRTP